MRAGIRAPGLNRSHGARGAVCEKYRSRAHRSALCQCARPRSGGCCGRDGALAAAGIGVLSSVGAGALSGLLSDVIDSLQDGERLPTQEDFERVLESYRRDFLEKNDDRAATLRGDIAAVLREVDASSAALAMAIETGRRDIQQQLGDAFSRGWPLISLNLGFCS